MKRKIILRGIIGFPVGIAICYIVTMLISLASPNGSYVPCVQTLTEALGSEIKAVIFQGLLCGIMGSWIGAISLIWDLEKISLVKQTGLYFILLSSIMLPVAYLNHWMHHSLMGIIQYVLIFLLIFVIIWAVEYVISWKNVQEFNKKVG